MSTSDEGYIKFQANWQQAPPFSWAELEELDRRRNEMYDA